MKIRIKNNLKVNQAVMISGKPYPVIIAMPMAEFFGKEIEVDEKKLSRYGKDFYVQSDLPYGEWHWHKTWVEEQDKDNQI